MFGPLLGNITPLAVSQRIILSRFIRATAPELWFKFNEPLLSTTLVNYGSLASHNGTGTNTVSGQAGALSNPGAWQFNSGANAIINLAGGAFLNNPAWTHCMLMNVPNAGQNGSGSFWSTSSGGAYHSRFGLNSLNTIRCERTTTATTAVAESSATALTANVTAWVFWTFTTTDMIIHEYVGKSGTLTEVTYSTHTTGTGSLSDRSADTFVLGNETGLNNGWFGLMMHYMEYNKVLSTAQMTRIVQLSRV